MARIVVLFVLFYFSAPAQTDKVYTGRDTSQTPRERRPPKNTDWMKKMSFGGNFQAWFGNPTFIFLSPTIGYDITERLNAGIGGIYSYQQFDNGYYGTFKQSTFGVHTYIRYVIAQSFFVQTQFDDLYQNDYYSYNPNEKVWVPYWLLGCGFRQSIGDKAALTTSLLYNLTPNRLSIYPSRIILQFGVSMGF
jgi:hypothetical protein